MLQNEIPDASSKISVLLYLPGQIVLKIGICRKAHIRALRKALPKGEKFDLIFEGTVLLDSLSLDAYKIKHQSVITAVKPNCRNSREKQFLYNQSIDLVTGTFGSVSTPRAKSELFRLNDLQLAKMERSPQQFRKLVKAFEQRADKEPIQKRNFKFSYIKPKTPRKDPLPKFWADADLNSTMHAKREIEQMKKQDTPGIDLIGI